MSIGDAAAMDRAIAHTLSDLVRDAVAPGAAGSAFATARDAAQLLSLDGLDHALAACAVYAGSPWTADVAAVADRLARLAAAVRESGELTPLREADPELEALARQLDGFERGDTVEGDDEGRGRAPMLAVSEVLDDIPLAGDDSRAASRRSFLPVPVAAAVRAAIEWLVPASGAAPVRLHGEPSLLELRLERIRTDRLYAAHRVIAAAGGNIGPAAEGTGWTVRVPSYAERPTYLLLITGGLRIAVPWHAVLKLRIVPAHGAPGAAWSMEYVMLPSLASPSADVGEHPVVLIGHGLKRGYLPVDRLIWRMPADACVNEWGSPGAGLTETVRTEDGEVFWVADPARLLAHAELPEIATEPADAQTQPPVLSEADVRPLEVSEPPQLDPNLLTLAPAEPEPSEPAPPRPPIARPVPATARALVADDSLTTRLLLTRLLEQQGFAVETVSSSAALMARLERSVWTVVFTDLELPDGSGPEWLRRVRRVAALRPWPVHVVALVRDGGDLDVARAAGVEDTLLKPFARESLAALVARRGWIRS